MRNLEDALRAARGDAPVPVSAGALDAILDGVERRASRRRRRDRVVLGLMIFTAAFGAWVTLTGPNGSGDGAIPVAVTGGPGAPSHGASPGPSVTSLSRAGESAHLDDAGLATWIGHDVQQARQAIEGSGHAVRIEEVDGPQWPGNVVDVLVEPSPSVSAPLEIVLQVASDESTIGVYPPAAELDARSVIGALCDAPDDLASEEPVVTVYYYCAGDGTTASPLLPRSRSVPEASLAAAIDALIAGPTPEEAAAGYWTMVDPGALVRDPVVTLDGDGRAYVDLGTDPHRYPNFGTTNVSGLYLRQIESTIHARPEVRSLDSSALCAGTEFDCDDR